MGEGLDVLHERGAAIDASFEWTRRYGRRQSDAVIDEVHRGGFLACHVLRGSVDNQRVALLLRRPIGKTALQRGQRRSVFGADVIHDLGCADSACGNGSAVEDEMRTLLHQTAVLVTRVARPQLR